MEGDSYEAGKGLGIDATGAGQTEEASASSSQSQDEHMETVADQLQQHHEHLDHANEGDSSNDTFELDLDQAFNEPGTATASSHVGQVSMQIDGKSVILDDAAEASATAAPAAAPRTQSRKRGHSTSVQRSVKTVNRHEIDPDDWLAIRATIQREAEMKVAEVQKEYREELDVWDISMVAEYSEEIFDYMEELEVNRRFGFSLTTFVDFHSDHGLFHFILIERYYAQP